MTAQLVIPRLQRDADELLKQAIRIAEEEAFPIVHVDRRKFRQNRSTMEDISQFWQSRGYGCPIIENDGYGDTMMWSFSDEGLRAGNRLIQRYKRRHWWSRRRNNGIAIFGLVASVMAAIAAALSAYFSYLGLPKH